MSLIYLHGERLMPLMPGLPVFAVLGWGAIIYMLYKFRQNRKK